MPYDTSHANKMLMMKILQRFVYKMEELEILFPTLVIFYRYATRDVRVKPNYVELAYNMEHCVVLFFLPTVRSTDPFPDTNQSRTK